MSFSNPGTATTQRPYLAVKVKLIAASNMRVTIWNEGGGFVYVRGIPANEEAYFMNSGSGDGTNKFTSFSGTWIAIIYECDNAGYALNTFHIRPYVILYQADMNLAL